MEVDTSGTQLFQLQTQNTVIDVFVEKADGSGDTLEAGVYNGGTLVEEKKTSSPRGVLELHVTVGPAIVSNTVPVSVPVTESATPVPTAASLYNLPRTGVWVHVLYPGDYSGYVSSNGQQKEVNSTGEQFFQLPMTRGVVDASIAKSDKSGNTLAVEVYRNGELVDLANTTTPQGVVEIHTSV